MGKKQRAKIPLIKSQGRHIGAKSHCGVSEAHGVQGIGLLGDPTAEKNPVLVE